MQGTQQTTQQKSQTYDRIRQEKVKRLMDADIKSGRLLFQSNNIFNHTSYREVSMEEIKSKIDKETLFLFAFVPFVIAEIAWDYADTCKDITITMGLTKTKRLNRYIRELRRDYNRKRSTIDSEHRQIETDNMIAFQEDYKQFFLQLNCNIQNQVENEHPGLTMDLKLLISGSYSCAVVLRSLFKYVSIMERRIADMLGIKAVGSIIVPELRKLDAIILQYAGEESIGSNNRFPASLNPYVETLVNYLLQSEMIELPCPIN